MILFLIEFLREFNIRVPSVFSYYSTRIILAAITSLLLSIFLGPFFIRKLYELKIGQSIRKEDCPLLGQLHEKKTKHPYDGWHIDSFFHDHFAFVMDGSKTYFYLYSFRNNSFSRRYRRKG